MGNLDEKHELPSSQHFNILQEVVDVSFVRQSLVRSYTRSFNGFAAYLTPQEHEKLAESESFNDKGFGPPPKKWKGVCKGGFNFTCNNKLIGARSYGSDSARDTQGHGTHTASTAAGNIVIGASFNGIAKGTARGAVPSSRIAAYNVCIPNQGCSSKDILAGFDDAIADGSFHALQKGILVIQSAGNEGFRGSVASVAPWILTAGASITDRGFVYKSCSWKRKCTYWGTVLGKSVNSFKLNGTTYLVPLVYGKEVSAKQCDEEAAKKCKAGCLQHNLVKGRIVLCDDFVGRREAFRAGALGSIGTYEDVKADVTFIVPLPDVVAPGVDILAAFSPKAPPSTIPSDKRSVSYSILSGTSMACPHVAGAAAYIKSLHPDWSPSAIKSALMTTGHIDPVKAADPGLVYETVQDDYVKMLCGLGSNTTTIRNIFGVNVNCSEGFKINPKDLNYPSMTVNIGVFRE
ncbi:hypothetical protein RD792_015316 [Penstemon davidsonii]|uniref:Uncharacterized protein n=1 Tax=Penstemon davidsonii TaxID=160366 RepID=A0ABR0CTE2_9LAMI|nr:hypothetical protein RD792_015316 [Penstemon davidsonii]